MPAADEVSGEHNVAGGGLASTAQCFANNPPSNASLNRMQLSDMAQINCYQEVYLKFSTATMMCTNRNTILHWKKDALLAGTAYSMGGISYQSKRPSQLATSNRWNMLFPVAGHVLFDLPRLQATSPEMVPCAI